MEQKLIWFINIPTLCMIVYPKHKVNQPFSHKLLIFAMCFWYNDSKNRWHIKVMWTYCIQTFISIRQKYWYLLINNEFHQHQVLWKKGKIHDIDIDMVWVNFKNTIITFANILRECDNGKDCDWEWKWKNRE